MKAFNRRDVLKVTIGSAVMTRAPPVIYHSTPAHDWRLIRGHKKQVQVWHDRRGWVTIARDYKGSTFFGEKV